MSHTWQERAEYMRDERDAALKRERALRTAIKRHQERTVADALGGRPQGAAFVFTAKDSALYRALSDEEGST